MIDISKYCYDQQEHKLMLNIRMAIYYPNSPIFRHDEINND